MQEEIYILRDVVSKNFHIIESVVLHNQGCTMRRSTVCNTGQWSLMQKAVHLPNIGAEKFTDTQTGPDQVLRL